MQTEALTTTGDQRSISQSKTFETRLPLTLPATIPDDGLAISDVYDAAFVPVSGEDFTWGQLAIATNYGLAVRDFKDKFELVKQEVKARGWSGMRFRAAIKHLLSTQRFATWTLADVLGYQSDTKLKPFHNGCLPVGPADIYKIDGRYFWKQSDGVDLPFEKVNVTKPEPPKQEPVASADPERVQSILASIGLKRLPANEQQLITTAKTEAERVFKGN